VRVRVCAQNYRRSQIPGSASLITGEGSSHAQSSGRTPRPPRCASAARSVSSPGAARRSPCDGVPLRIAERRPAVTGLDIPPHSRIPHAAPRPEPAPAGHSAGIAVLQVPLPTLRFAGLRAGRRRHARLHSGSSPHRNGRTQPLGPDNALWSPIGDASVSPVSRGSPGDAPPAHAPRAGAGGPRHRYRATRT